jgi:hypothetical protein
MWIRIRILPPCDFDADPDPVFHCDADPCISDIRIRNTDANKAETMASAY